MPRRIVPSELATKPSAAARAPASRRHHPPRRTRLAVTRRAPAMQRRLVHRGDEKLIVRTENNAEMRSRPFQNFGLRRHVGKPQRRAVIMRDRKAQALRRECQSADGRGHLERFFLGLPAADNGGLAGRPRHGPFRMKRDIVDPAPFRVSREQRDLAFDIERDQLAIIAADHDALTIASGAKDAAAMDDDRRYLALAAYKENAFLGADENRVLADKMYRRDRHADFDRAHPV